MEITQRLERASSNTEKKRLLKAENKYLQDNMKQMSENVNLLIEKMNQETLKSKPNKKPQNPKTPKPQNPAGGSLNNRILIKRVYRLFVAIVSSISGVSKCLLLGVTVLSLSSRLVSRLLDS